MCSVLYSPPQLLKKSAKIGPLLLIPSPQSINIFNNNDSHKTRNDPSNFFKFSTNNISTNIRLFKNEKAHTVLYN